MSLLVFTFMLLNCNNIASIINRSITKITVILNCSLHNYFYSIYVKINKNLERNVGKEMNLKNILLGMVAVILSLCLAFLLFIATNQNALAKVHQTISTFSKMSSVSATEKMLDITTSHTAKASEKNADERKMETHYNKIDSTSHDNANSNKHEYSSEECRIIAQNYTNHQYGKVVNLERSGETNQDITYQLNPNHQSQSSNIAVNKTRKIEALSNNAQ